MEIRKKNSLRITSCCHDLIFPTGLKVSEKGRFEIFGQEISNDFLSKVLKIQERMTANFEEK